MENIIINKGIKRFLNGRFKSFMFTGDCNTVHCAELHGYRLVQGVLNNFLDCDVESHKEHLFL